ncbi:MAG: caspase family protein, partial [Sinobacterium sp.]|nr:caspase family protein [Sinobacterium sp.]
ANAKRKVRTVVTKNQPTFNDNTTELIAKDINFGKYYALVIGIADYDNVEKLDTPINDINSIAAVLENDYGFTVTKLLNADNISVMEAVNNLNAQLGKNDNLLIFYAGHGVTVETGDAESGYWLPSNADAPPRDTNWVSNEFITRHLARLKAKRVLVVADSCYAGLLSNSPDFLMLGDNQNSAEFLKYKADKRSRLLLTSGGNLPVLDRATKDAKHSIFAGAFLDALNNNEGILTGPQLYRSIHDQVLESSKTAQFKQEPAYQVIKGAGHEVGEFFFVKQG